MSGRDGEIRLGLLQADAGQLAQIEAWVANFRKANASVETVQKPGQNSFDLFLAVLDNHVDPATGVNDLGQLAGPTPYIILALQDDEQAMEAALAAGAADYLPIPTLNGAELERAVRFSINRRHGVDRLKARQACLAAAYERDRQQIANALHDGPLQDLIGARFLLGALGPNVPTGDVQESLQQVSQAVRGLCSELKPPALGPFGLEKAIRGHMQGFQSLHPDMAVTLDLDVDQQQLPEWARYALFRVFQAAVQNVVDHAQATQLWVRLHLDPDHIKLTVADDGQGFDPPANWLDFAATERCGLLTMQERVDALQGRMMVQSSPGSGTRVVVKVPVNQPRRPLPGYLASAAPERNG